MAFDDLDSGNGSLNQINVTPLVDVMLVLLIIFMVAAPVIQQGVELQLPKETTAALKGKGEQLIVSITKDGNVFLGSKTPIEVKSLGERVKAVLEEKGEDKVFIKADENAKYGSVMAALASIRRAGIVNVGLVTEPGERL